MRTSPQTQVQVLHVPGCALVDQVRSLLNDCMRCAGVQPLVQIVPGTYPSPTVLINGLDGWATIRPLESAIWRSALASWWVNDSVRSCSSSLEASRCLFESGKSR